MVSWLLGDAKYALLNLLGSHHQSSYRDALVSPLARSPPTGSGFTLAESAEYMTPSL